MGFWENEDWEELDRKLNKVQEQVNLIEEQMLSMLKVVALIAKAVGVGSAVKMELQFKGEEKNMPGQETDTQTIPCSAIETDAAGQPVTLNPANVQWAIDDATVAAMTQNADGSATFKALKIGTANVTCKDTVANITGTDSLAVTAGPANKLVLNFGTAA